MSTPVLKRYIVAIAILTALTVVVSQVLESRSARLPGDYETELGTLRLEDGLLDEALLHYDEALAKSPNHRGALMGKALVSIEQEDYGEAERQLDALIDYLQETLLGDDPTGRGTLAAAFANRGIVKDRMGRYELALDDYLQALQVDSQAVDGPGLIDKILYGSEHVSSVQLRAQYLHQQLQLPESERVMRIPTLDAKQRSHKP